MRIFTTLVAILLFSFPVFSQDQFDLTCGDAPVTDPDGDTFEIMWTPLPGTTFSDASGFAITVTREDIPVGEYEIECTVVDEHGAEASAVVGRLIVTQNQRPVITLSPGGPPTIIWVLDPDEIGFFQPNITLEMAQVIDVRPCDSEYDRRGVRRPQVIIQSANNFCDAGDIEYQDFELAKFPL